MGRILPLLLLATLGCDSTGIMLSNASVPRLVDHDKGECMDHVCPPDDPGAESLEVSWAGMSEPDCIEVTHRCASFNCCTTLRPFLEPSGTSLYISEVERGDECWCTCRYHPRYTICGLTAGSWNVVIMGAGLSTGVTVP